MLRRLACAAAFLLAAAAASARAKVISTRWFEIVFLPESRESALLVAQRADEFYEEICRKLDCEPYFRMVVCLTPEVEDFNAYYANVPYHRIVLYDTPPMRGMAVSADTILSTFYHELSHAVSMSIKNGFWRTLSSIFADAISPAGIGTTKSMSEGTAVLLESQMQELNGGTDDGRLNDAFSKEFVIRAKADGNFPAWSDVLGARDLAPGGTTSYIFGGMFWDFVRRKYGAKKFSLLWERCSNWNSLRTFVGHFKSIYGMSVKSAWQEFYDSVPTEENPLEFFGDEEGGRAPSPARFTEAPQIGGISFFRKEGAASKGEFDAFWCNYANSTVYRGKKKFLYVRGLRSASVSADGRTLAVTRVAQKSRVKTEVFLCDVKTRRVRKQGLSGAREAAVIGGLLVADCPLSQNSTVKAFALDGLRAAREPSAVLDLGRDAHPYEFFAAPDGQVGFVLAKVPVNAVCLWNPETGAVQKFEPAFDRDSGEKAKPKFSMMNVREEECGGNFALSFDYVTEDSILPRRGIFVLGEKPYFSLSKAEPLKESHFGFDALNFPADFGGEPSERIAASVQTERNPKAPEEADSNNSDSGSRKELRFEEKGYFAPKYYLDGVFLPVGLNGAYKRNLEPAASGSQGATWYSSDPWGHNALTLSGGYLPSLKAWGARLGFSSGEESDISFSIDGNAVFGERRQAYGQAGASAFLMPGRILTFTLSNYAFGFYGIDPEYEGTAFEKADFVSAKDMAALEVSTVRQSGPRYLDMAGIFFGPQFYVEYAGIDDGGIRGRRRANAGAFAGAYVPFILPVYARTSLFPAIDVLWQNDARLTLFCLDIERGLGIVPLYLRRALLDVTYGSRLEYDSSRSMELPRIRKILDGKTEFSDILSLNVRIEWGANATILAQPNIFVSTSAGAFWRPHRNGRQKEFGVSIGATMGY